MRQGHCDRQRLKCLTAHARGPSLWNHRNESLTAGQVTVAVGSLQNTSGVDEQLERLWKNWQVGALCQTRAQGDHPVRFPTCYGGNHLRYFTVFEPRIARCRDQRFKCFLIMLEELKQLIYGM
jgi:hypothetical protein